MVPMTSALLKAWRLTGSVECRVVVDDSKALFQFESESDLLWVLDQEPWSFNDWMLVVDRFDRRDEPDYLRFMNFWVEIVGIPWNYRNDAVIKRIGSVVGEVLEIHEQGPGVRARIRVDVNEGLEFERRVLFERSDEDVEVRFVYEKLKMFCQTCGSLAHHKARCPDE
ncbi:unnamed protein product [Microthlaspi erraticum]|nr:unnamed protein product [Microthlaspi erraticum]